MQGIYRGAGHAPCSRGQADDFLIPRQRFPLHSILSLWDVIRDGAPIMEPFVCMLLDADDAGFVVKGRGASIAYARLLSGTLPPRMRSVLVHSDAPFPWITLHGRPEKGGFVPLRATLTVPEGRSYAVTVLATLPDLDGMRPYLRAGLNPPPGIEQGAIPLALEGLPREFRATSGQLTSAGDAEPEGSYDRETLWAHLMRLQQEALGRAMEVATLTRRYGRDAPVEPILHALSDEMFDVRDAAAHHMSYIAHRLPWRSFLPAVRDMRQLNFPALLAAAHVFAAHSDEVPIEVLFDLFHNACPRQWGHPLVQIVVVRAMGQLGDLVTPEAIALLAGILLEQRTIYDIRVRAQAAAALGMLGSTAPVEALIAGMAFPQPEVAAVAARSLVQHPAAIADDVRERARAMSDLETARRTIYGRRLNRTQQHPPSSQPAE